MRGVVHEAEVGATGRPVVGAGHPGPRRPIPIPGLGDQVLVGVAATEQGRHAARRVIDHEGVVAGGRGRRLHLAPRRAVPFPGLRHAIGAGQWLAAVADHDVPVGVVGDAGDEHRGRTVIGHQRPRRAVPAPDLFRGRASALLADAVEEQQPVSSRNRRRTGPPGSRAGHRRRAHRSQTPMPMRRLTRRRESPPHAASVIARLATRTRPTLRIRKQIGIHRAFRFIGFTRAPQRSYSLDACAARNVTHRPRKPMPDGLPR